MTEANATRYRHTQTGPWFVLLYAVAGVLLVVCWLFRDVPETPVFIPVTLLVLGAFLLLLAMSFQHLTVADEGDHLAIGFGPLPVFRKKIRYEDLRGVERGQTSLLTGFGLRMNLRGEQIWNIWGYNCVLLHHRETTWVGTDEAEALLQFLKSKLPSPAVEGTKVER